MIPSCSNVLIKNNKKKGTFWQNTAVHFEADTGFLGLILYEIRYDSFGAAILVFSAVGL